MVAGSSASNARCVGPAAQRGEAMGVAVARRAGGRGVGARPHRGWRRRMRPAAAGTAAAVLMEEAEAGEGVWMKNLMGVVLCTNLKH